MNERIPRDRLYAVEPVLRQSLVALDNAASKAGLEGSLIKLVKLRASQINGCAFCLHMHAAEARQLGIDQQRLDVLAAWREAGCFSAREQAALAWAEALTRISEPAGQNETYAALVASFSEAEIAGLTAAILAINSWNRLAIGFAMKPPIAR